MTAANAEVVPAEPRADVEQLRAQFPTLNQEVHGQPLVYLDSAASALKPRAVIAAIVQLYEHDYSNVHRGVHTLSQRATDAYEGARDTVQQFLGAAAREEVVFVRGTTEGINLVAQSAARPKLGPGDQVLITGLEHHSNIVPWQIVCEQTGAELVVVPINDAGEVTPEAFEAKLSPRTRIAALAHVSNALGTVLPVRQLADMAKARGALVVVDGAQAVPHVPVDVGDLGCDFYAFSGHKLYGPTGIGALWGRRELLEAMPPYQGGGDMIASVSFEKTTYNDLPYKFEAGTPNIAGAVGLGAAIRWFTSLDLPAQLAREDALLDYGTKRLLEIPGLRMVGTAAHKVAALSFVIDGAHPQDIGTLIDTMGVAIRTGHHCAEPVMDRFGIPGTARASLGIYNDQRDIDRLVEAVARARDMCL